VDAAFAAHVSQGATGFVLRVGAGRFEGGHARWNFHGLDALMMEAYACRDGIRLATEKGVTKLQLETAGAGQSVGAGTRLEITYCTNHQGLHRA